MVNQSLRKTKNKKNTLFSNLRILQIVSLVIININKNLHHIFDDDDDDDDDDDYNEDEENNLNTSFLINEILYDGNNL